MLVFTPEDIDISRLNVENTSQWIILLEHDGEPYEIFSDVPFLTPGQSGDLYEYKSLLLIFDNEEAALDAFSTIRGPNKKHLKLDSPCEAKAVLVHNGILIDDTEN